LPNYKFNYTSRTRRSLAFFVCVNNKNCLISVPTFALLYSIIKEQCKSEFVYALFARKQYSTWPISCGQWTMPGRCLPPSKIPFSPAELWRLVCQSFEAGVFTVTKQIYTYICRLRSLWVRVRLNQSRTNCIKKLWKKIGKQDRNQQMKLHYFLCFIMFSYDFFFVLAK